MSRKVQRSSAVTWDFSSRDAETFCSLTSQGYADSRWAFNLGYLRVLRFVQRRHRSAFDVRNATPLCSPWFKNSGHPPTRFRFQPFTGLSFKLPVLGRHRLRDLSPSPQFAALPKFAGYAIVDGFGMQPSGSEPPSGRNTQPVSITNR